ncbi:MAG: L,D-transpeptidase family protein [Desulfuromonadales bacterium]|nr:L,D-transpeptidase family protein [Desulfuromonadales bacterium]
MRESVLKENPKLTDRVVRFLCQGGWMYIGILVALAALCAALFVHTTGVRYRRDVSRLVLEDRLDILDSARWNVAVSEKMLRDSERRPEPPHNRPYLVISIVERRLWYKQGGEVLLTTRVATGSGKTLVKEMGASVWKFETPRGRLAVMSKEEKPLWVPPDWYYVEQARKRKLGLVHLERGQSLSAADGSIIKVAGTDVVREHPDGRQSILKASDGHDIIVDGKVLVPPLGTSQRRFEGVLGTHRLNIGNGYGMHGTNRPETIGRAVSHGCVRLLNEDIAKLYEMVPIGTPVYIY